MENEQKIQRRFSHKGLQLLGVAVLLGLACTSLVFIQNRPAAAANTGSTYKWKPLKIGGGGFVTGMALSSAGATYARTDVGGAYHWNMHTQSWDQMILAGRVPQPNSNDYSVESIATSAQNGAIVYVAVGGDLSNDDNRILTSTNSGQSWSDSGYRWKMGGNSDARTGGERLAIDPHNSNVAYFGSRAEGLWVTTDGAKHWQQISQSIIPLGTSPGTSFGVKFVIFDPNSAVINGKTSRIYAGISGVGVFRSDDAGQTWTQILTTTDLPYDDSLASDGTLYVSIASFTANGKVEKYNPTANTWTDITPGSDNYIVVAVDPFNPLRVFAGGGGVHNGNVWRSTDGGATWTTLSIAVSSPKIPWITKTDEQYYMSAGNFYFDPVVHDLLWFPQGTGVWQATNLTDPSVITWNFVSQGIEEFVSTDVLVPPGGKPIVTVDDRNGFYKGDPDTYPQQTILTQKFSAGTSIDYSGDNPKFVVVESSDTRLLNPPQSGYSTDGGKTWTQFSGLSNTPDLYGGNIAVSATNTNEIIWLPTNNKKPYVTLDRGKTWYPLTFFNNVSTLHTMIWWGSKKALDSDKVNGSFYIYSTDNGGKFFRSSDGVNWQQAAGQAPPGGPSVGNDAHVFGQVRAVPGYANNVWVSVAQGGLYYTQDAGTSWTKANGVQDARSFGFGSPLAASPYPAVYLYGEVNNMWGVYRSIDQGNSWTLLARYPGGLYAGVSTVAGDMSIPGRVYLGIGGNGFLYGDDTQLPTPTPNPSITPFQTPSPTPSPTPPPSNSTNILTASTPPTIDGSGSDAIWSTAPVNAISNVVDGSPVGFTGSFQTAWDSNNLYFLVTINDATASSHPDAAEIYLDPGRNRGASYDSADMQYVFGSDTTTVSQYNDGSPGTNTAGIVYATGSSSSGYTIEISIPWARLGGKPKVGSQIGLDIDIAQDYKNAREKLFWNSTTDSDWTDPDVFGYGVFQ